MRLITITIILISVIFPQDILDQQVLGKIKIEAFQNSQIMETLSRISDVHGGRIMGSPAYKAAADWCVSQLNEWDVSAGLEPWGTVENSWSYESASVKLVAPYPAQLIAYPLAYSAGTGGIISGKPIFVNIQSPADIEKYRGTLGGRIVFNGKAGKANPNFQADARRMDEEELNKERTMVTPSMRNIPAKSWGRYLDWQTETDTIAEFFRDEGIAALVTPSERSHGIVRVTTLSYDRSLAGAYPGLVLAREHFNRIYRLDKLGETVEVSIDVSAEVLPPATGYNVIAEIPGSDRRLKNEVVLLGAHLDSWHAGTGAVDDAGNCATVMEVLRIIKKLGLKPKRTIRIGLWDGEEVGYLGSLGYIKKHYGDPSTMELLPGHKNLSVYLNLDGGCGKIRGVYLQGNEMARPFFEQGLEPFNYLGVGTLSADMVSYTDHMPFNWVGLPGFDMIQDPIEYSTRTHHSNMDVYEAVIEDDVKINAAVLTALALIAANREEKIPRVELPAAE